MRKVLGTTLITLFLAGCGKSDSGGPADKPALDIPPISDAELADLVPDFVDAQSMPWLAGNWGVFAGSTYEGTSCKDGGAMRLVTSGYVFDVNSDPEPAKAGTAKTSGTVNVSKGEDPGFFNLTPPKWEDAYFRLKPRSKNRLTAQIWSFSSEKTEWFKTHEFEFERCE